MDKGIDFSRRSASEAQPASTAPAEPDSKNSSLSLTVVYRFLFEQSSAAKTVPENFKRPFPFIKDPKKLIVDRYGSSLLIAARVLEELKKKDFTQEGAHGAAPGIYLLVHPDEAFFQSSNPIQQPKAEVMKPAQPIAQQVFRPVLLTRPEPKKAEDGSLYYKRPKGRRSDAQAQEAKLLREQHLYLLYEHLWNVASKRTGIQIELPAEFLAESAIGVYLTQAEHLHALDQMAKQKWIKLKTDYSEATVLKPFSEVAKFVPNKGSPATVPSSAPASGPTSPKSVQRRLEALETENRELTRRNQELDQKVVSLVKLFDTIKSGLSTLAEQAAKALIDKK